MRHTRNKRDIITGTVLLLFGIAGTTLAVSGFSGTGFFREYLCSAATIQMFTELLLIFLYLVLSGLLLRKQMMRNLFFLFGISVFLWIHRIFMPVAVCGLYCGFLILSGEVLLVPLRKKEGARSSSGVIRVAHDFLTGCAFYMIFIEFLSYLGLGSLSLIRLLTGIIFVIMLLLFFLFDHSRLLPLPYAALPPEHVHGQPEENRTEKVILLSLTAVLILLQAGRLNIALDYDSLHYGLRTPYILNNGHGIYENLGLVNDVYFYPKGFEILAMPLSGVPTFGFVLAFSLIAAVFCLVMIGNAASEISGKRAGIRAAFLAACIPGIMNMAVSAKSDIGTLLFQVIFLNDLILYLKDTDGETGNRFFLWGTASLFMTLTMKPTSFVFSAVLFLTALPVCLAERKKKKKSGYGKGRSCHDHPAGSDRTFRRDRKNVSSDRISGCLGIYFRVVCSRA